MKETRHSTARFAGFAAAAALVAASAFADSRPPKMTREDAKDRQIISRGAARGVSEGRNYDDDRGERRGRGDRDARADKGKGHGKREAHQAQGRVTKVQKWHDGHRVWVSGTPHPFYVPAPYWHRDRFRVGVTVRIGGYYNPAGWYDYDCYDCGRDVIRGVVSGVDYRRDLADVRLRNGDYVTVILPRHDGRIRPGDYVEVFGDWTRRGVFEAYDFDVLDRYRR